MCQPGSKGRKVILSSDRENKTEMLSICLLVSFTPTHVPRNMLVNCISYECHQTISIYVYRLKKNPTFKTITDFIRKAKIFATNILKTHKQANAYHSLPDCLPCCSEQWAELDVVPLPSAPSLQHQQRTGAETTPAEQVWSSRAESYPAAGTLLAVQAPADLCSDFTEASCVSVAVG